MINKRWLDELGLAVPTTLDELHTALKPSRTTICLPRSTVMHPAAPSDVHRL